VVNLKAEESFLEFGDPGKQKGRDVDDSSGSKGGCMSEVTGYKCGFGN
jgi:hypothetical protein